MEKQKDMHKSDCQVCGGSTKIDEKNNGLLLCKFCGFRKKTSRGDHTNQNLLSAKDVNIFFRSLYRSMDHGETTQLSIPVSRFYATPPAQDGQVNFFKSKNIMFLLEQNGFHMVSRKSRFSTSLELIIKKV